MKNEIIQGDCLNVMPSIPSGSVDMILCDLPYGTTACKWDTIIPFKPMWVQLHRIIKGNGAIVLFGSEPFSSYLRMSNIKNYKYDWIMSKNKCGNFMLCKTQPLKHHEIISVFSLGKATYYPIMEFVGIKDKRKKNNLRNKMKNGGAFGNNLIGYTHKPDKGNRYPKSIINVNNADTTKAKYHPTQKVVTLIEYLIKTYTLKNETVLDFTIGSGTTAVACINTNRNFIGIEKEEEYVEKARERVEQAKRMLLKF